MFSLSRRKSGVGTHVDVHVAVVRETGEVAGLGEVGAVLGEVCGSRGGKRSVDVTRNCANLARLIRAAAECRRNVGAEGNETSRGLRGDESRRHGDEEESMGIMEKSLTGLEVGDGQGDAATLGDIGGGDNLELILGALAIGVDGDL